MRFAKNPDDEVAVNRILNTPQTFLWPIPFEEEEKFFLKVIVETARGNIEKSRWYYVTRNYPSTAFHLAMDVYRKIIEALPKSSVIIDSRVQVKLL